MRLFRGVQSRPAALAGAGLLLAATGAAAQPAPAQAPAEPAPPPGGQPAAPAAEPQPGRAAPAAEQPAPAGEPAPAQPAPAQPAEPAPAGPAAAGTAAPAPAAAQPAPAPEPAAPPMAASEPAPAAATPMPDQPAEPPADEPAEDDSPVAFSLFADAYYNFQTARQGTPAPYHRAYAWNSPAGPGGTFVNENGFSLSFVGLDATYDTGKFAATTSIRFGPSVPIFYAGHKSLLGIENILQGYVTWRPTDKLTLDLGQFGTIFGAEVAESWQNLNYSRGGLYYAMQPFWHTGLRAAYAFSDAFTLTGMVVDGTNIVSEAENPDNESPTLALQAGITPSDAFSLAIGGMVAPAGDTEGSGFDTFGDLVAVLSLDKFTGIFNADINLDRGVPDGMGGETDNLFGGVSLALAYQFVPAFGVALRGEYLIDADNALWQAQKSDGTLASNNAVATGTLTLDFKPIPDSKNLIIRWDNRIEGSTHDIYYNRDAPKMTDMDGNTFFGSPNAGTWFGSVIGVVVTTDG